MCKNTKTFVNENNIKIDVEYADCNPNMNDPKWNANHYKTTLKFNRKQLTVYFSMGIAINHEPTAYDVLDSLAMDSYTYINNDTFENFCNEFGYDEDSRKAEKTYNVIIKQSEKLEKFLGQELFNSLVNDYERL